MLLARLWQSVEVNMYHWGLGTARGRASLYEDIRALLLGVWKRVCAMSKCVCECWVIYAIVRV